MQKENSSNENEINKNQSKYLDSLVKIEHIIFNLNENNLDSSVQQTMELFDSEFQISFNLIISNLIYYAFCAQKNVIETSLKYLQTIQDKEQEINKDNQKVIDIFIDLVLRMRTTESIYIIEKMIEGKFFNDEMANQIQNIIYKTHQNYNEQNKINILNNSDDPSKTGYELHKKLIEEGINPDELAKIIRYDEIEKLQEKSTQNEFNFNQNIEPSAYERYSFINEKNVTLIDFAAFFGSVKCFKFLLLNGANVQNTGKYAVAGGNLEIMHLCEQNHSTFEKGYEIAIKFHQKDIFKYLYESKIIGIKNLEELGKKCITSFNYKIFLFLQENGMNINDDIVNESARIGNLYLVKHFIQNNQIPNNILVYSLESGNMQVIKLLLDQGVDVNARNESGETPLIVASKNGFIEVVKMLLGKEGVDVNAQDDSENNALIFAAEFGRTGIFKLLLEQKGIDINHHNWRLWSPLMIAIENGCTEMVKLLLEQDGIDTTTTNMYGMKPREIAMYQFNPEIIKLLDDHEKKANNKNDKKKIY